MPNPYINIDLTQALTGIREWLIGVQRGFEEGIPFAVQSGFQVSQERVPVRTGNLKSSGHVESGSSLVISIIYDAGYAGYVEHGTSNMRAQPYCEPAFQEIIRILPSAIKERSGT
jgi:HK97 gp10 family phage protein